MNEVETPAKEENITDCLENDVKTSTEITNNSENESAVTEKENEENIKNKELNEKAGDSVKEQDAEINDEQNIESPQNGCKRSYDSLSEAVDVSSDKKAKVELVEVAKLDSEPICIPIKTNLSRSIILQNISNKPLLEDYYGFQSEYCELFTKITNSFKIGKVRKINNPYLYGMYMLTKNELDIDTKWDKTVVKEQWLYHATSEENAENIAKTNIDWRKTVNSRFGIGVCFTPDPSYANRYAKSKSVLIKRVESVGKSYYLQVPKINHNDTTLDKFGKVYVKYDDYHFYPELIISYSPK